MLLLFLANTSIALSQNTTIEVPINVMENLYRLDLKHEALQLAFKNRGNTLNKLIISNSKELLKQSATIEASEINKAIISDLNNKILELENKPNTFLRDFGLGALVAFILLLIV